MVMPGLGNYTIRPAQRIVTPGDDSLERLLRVSFPWVSPEGIFFFNAFGAGTWCQQGWKIHVSATATNANVILARVLPLLRDAGVRFKVISSLERLLELNGGVHGASQVGKFITLYPSDDEQAVEIAAALDRVVDGLQGPVVPSDRQLRPDSLVYYRYGGFRSPTGRTTTPMIFDAAGRLMPDYRLPYFWPMENWPPDPFIARGVSQPDGTTIGTFAERFLIIQAVQRSVWGRVYDALDLDALPPRRCVIKEYWHDVAMDVYGRDASDHAALEAAILTTCASSALPELYDTFTLEGNHYAVMEYVAGQNLAQDETLGLRRQMPLASADLLQIGQATAAAVRELHQQGVIHRDIKPHNVFITPDGRARLIDVAFAYRPGVDLGPALGYGTPGFMSPTQAEQRDPTITDDVYSWGAMLYFLAADTLPPASRTTQQLPMEPNYPIHKARPDLPEALSRIIDRAMCHDPSRRFNNMEEVLVALAACQSKQVQASPTLPPSLPGYPADVRWDQLARRTADVLDEHAHENQSGVSWPVIAEETTEITHPADLYLGAAGIGLFLAECAQKLGHQRSAALAKEAASWLSSGEWGHGSSLCGLYTGEAGVGMFYLKLAHLLDCPGYLTMALLRARRMQGVEMATIDLVDGSAGILIFLVELYESTGSIAMRDWAIDIGNALLSLALHSNAGLHWEVPSQIPGGSSHTYYGLLHGAAGIGLALLHLGVRFALAEFVAAAVQVGEYLLTVAKRSNGGHVSHLAWPRTSREERLASPAHCHGAGGIGQFLVRLWCATGDGRFLEAARSAAAAVVAREPVHTSQCHGLAGEGSLLLDLYQATGESHFHASAHERAQQLARFEDHEGGGIWRRSLSGSVSPEYMTGYAGVGAFCLRMADPERAADLILPGVQQFQV